MSSCSSPTLPPTAAAASSTLSRSQRRDLLLPSPGSHGDRASCAPPVKSGKLGFEGTQEVQHRIYITLSSKSVKILDKVDSYIPSFPPQDPLLAAIGSPPLRQQRLWFDEHPKTRRAAAKRTWVGEIGANDYAYNLMAADSIPPARIQTMAVDRVTTSSSCRSLPMEEQEDLWRGACGHHDHVIVV